MKGKERDKKNVCSACVVQKGFERSSKRPKGGVTTKVICEGDRIGYEEDHVNIIMNNCMLKSVAHT